MKKEQGVEGERKKTIYKIGLKMEHCTGGIIQKYRKIGESDWKVRNYNKWKF